MAQTQAVPCRFLLDLGLGNAAFEDPSELPRILRAIADSPDLACMGSRRDGVTIRDSNGNTVGGWWIEE